jgi:reactive intermediate/imine deaminase
MIEFFQSDAFKAAKIPLSNAVRAGDVLYLSGMLGDAPGKFELVPGGIEAETRQIMENIGALLKQHGLSFDDVFKCTVMLADMKQWGDFNKVYAQYFKPGHYPSRSAFGVGGLARGALVEVEAWAYAPKK